MKIALGVEYDGSAYCGWQIQKDAVTVEACLTEAVSRVADHQVKLHCAGRTDTGVHASAQVVHFETDARRELHAWILGVNVNLPADISGLWVQPVSDDFHARFSATGRVYRYFILNRLARPALLSGQITWQYQPLDEARMQEAAEHLVGEHDFSSYRASGCQAKSPVRDLRRLQVTRQGERVMIEVEANAFLHHMVRNIAGVLMTIGMGREEPDWAVDVLKARDRTLGGVTAAADGLYLIGVRYPAHFGLPDYNARAPFG